MKKLIVISMVMTVCGAMLSSCMRDIVSGKDDSDEKLVVMTFRSSLNTPTDEDATRTDIDSAFIKWQAKDSISVFDGTANRKFGLSAGAGTNAAEFTGEVVPTGTYYGLYPYISAASFSGGSITGVTVPAVQTVTSGHSVDTAATVMVAISKDNSLSFANAVAYIKVKPRVDCSRIVLRSKNSSDKLSGTGTVTLSDTAFSSVTGADSVVLTGSIDAQKIYYLAVMPGTYSSGIRMDFISGNDTLFYSDLSGTFKFERGRIYNGKSGKDTVYTDMSKGGTANCYIVTGSGNYSFKATKGNSDEVISGLNGVKVLWESFGTSATVHPGDIISDVKLSGGYISFLTHPGAFAKGNAVIAGYADSECEGDILWSWHIWATDMPSEQVYNNDAGTLMDRNLGATAADTVNGKDLVRTFGLLYQWGRKDPFLSGVDVDNTLAASTLDDWPVETVGNCLSGNNALSYSIAHPTTYITNGSNPKDWYCTSNIYRNDTLWDESGKKTIYDPCPAGWRLPKGGEKADDGVWEKAFDNEDYQFSMYFDPYHGCDFGKTDYKLVGTGDDVCWYPAAGYRSESNGSLGDCDKSGGALSYTAIYKDNCNKAWLMKFYNKPSDKRVLTHHTVVRAAALSVRCAKIE